MCPTSSNQNHKEDAAGPSLALDDLPRLQALVAGPDGAEILAELQRLTQREPQRARRFQRDLFARIRVDPRQPAEIAVVRDISRSGVRLRLSSVAQLDVLQARTISIEMRLPGSEFVNCEATLVRVVEHHKNGVELAFSFTKGTEANPAFNALFDHLATRAAASNAG